MSIGLLELRKDTNKFRLSYREIWENLPLLNKRICIVRGNINFAMFCYEIWSCLRIRGLEKIRARMLEANANNFDSKLVEPLRELRIFSDV